MRRSNSKGRKTNNHESENQSSGSPSVSVQMELELLALKAKNAELTKAHTRLVHENYEMKNEITTLRCALVDCEARSINVDEALNRLTQDIKRCTPSLLDVLNLFLQVSDKSRESGMLRISNRISNKGCTPKAKAITHTVKPHTVNGTVLNLNPTISLIRLNSGHDERSNEEPSSSTGSIDYMNSLPSTSHSPDNGMEDLGVEDADGNDENFVRKSHSSHRTSALQVSNSNDMENEESEDESEEEENDPASVRRLTTIHEESICSNSGQSRTSLGEIRIYLSRLSDQDMQALNDSTVANVNDTCLNIETTVIENVETQIGKRLRADIMVFSPPTNSTARMDSDNSIFEGSTPRDGGRRSFSMPLLSAIQNAEVTPSSSSLANEAEASATPVPWFPTPSMSAMGDVSGANCSKLEILAERSDRNPSPATSPVSILPRKTRSKKRRNVSSQLDEEDLPRTSRDAQFGRGTFSGFITRNRGGSDRILTPTIVLERLENTAVEVKTTRGLSPDPNEDVPKENENIPISTKKGKSKKSKSKSRSKSPRRNTKRQKIDESNSLQDKMKEIQVRLSNYVPHSPSDTSVQSDDNSGRKRPARAAKPKVLKDASLKGKNSRHSVPSVSQRMSPLHKT